MRTRSVMIMLAVALSWALTAQAQPVLNGVTNSASFIPAGLPNGGIAQGGFATFFGTGLSTSVEPILQTQSPLTTGLGGVSLQIAIGGATIDTWPTVVFGSQVSVVVPSNTPLGDGMATITVNGQASNAIPIRIVAHSFGMFGLNQAGSGPGILFDPINGGFNLLTNSAAPGEIWDIYGAGLGAVPFDEAVLPYEVVDLRGQVSIQVFIGGVEAPVLFAGRSRDTAGIDIIRVTIPAGISGCYLPTTIVINGLASNTVTTSVSATGGTCSDPNGPSPEVIESSLQGDGLQFGTITLLRNTFLLDTPQGPQETTSDLGTAEFSSVDSAVLFGAVPTSAVFAPGACLMYTFVLNEGDEAPGASDLDPVARQGLDAGPQLNANGPMGMRTIPQLAELGLYTEILGNNVNPLSPPLYLSGGQYTIDNGAGGADVGHFSVTGEYPDPVVWTSREATSQVPRGQPLLVTWGGGGLTEEDLIQITGTSFNFRDNAGALFLCQERAPRGQFLVPQYIVDAMPDTGLILGVPVGSMTVSNIRLMTQFEAPGLDWGLLVGGAGDSRTLTWGEGVEGGIPGGGGGGGGNGGGNGGGSLVLSSPSLVGGMLPQDSACPAQGGSNASPALMWEGAPTGTVSFGLLVEDLDADDFIHWGVWGIPASTRMIPMSGAVGIEGQNDSGTIGWAGPCTPSSGHRYRFRLFALNLDTANLGIPAGSPASAIRNVLEQFLGVQGSPIIGVAEFTATFGQ